MDAKTKLFLGCRCVSRGSLFSSVIRLEKIQRALSIRKIESLDEGQKS